jgi:ABC-type dipeptide/oligopeptide/nickel transport system permease subunit
MVEIHQVMWLVMLESGKNRILGVDTLGQHVLSRVRYGMVCLLIKDVLESVSRLDEWELA